MSKTNGQLARTLRRRAVEWSPRVADPRDARGRRHQHHGLLNLLVAGFASGLTTLRAIEDLSADLSAVARRVLGAAKRVSDTTLYLLLASQALEGMRETLVAQVQKLVQSKRVKNDLLSLGVAAVDGKSVWSSAWKHIEGAKEMTNDQGLIHASLAMLNAVLVSSAVRPALDLALIKEKSGEPPAFREMVRRVAAAFPGLVDVFTGDAGLMCRENALVVRGLGKHYVFAVKGNMQRLFPALQDMFAASASPSRVETTEQRSGAVVTRTLHTLTIGDIPDLGIYEAQEVWRLEQRTDANGTVKTEVRFFITSLPPRKLSPTEKLTLVRLHWGIENNRHWTLDAVFEEDDRQPCQLHRNAIEVTCWLRALAYNLVAAKRASTPKKDGRPREWKRVMQRLRDHFLNARREELAATLA